MTTDTVPETCPDCGLPVDDHNTRDDVGACPTPDAMTRCNACEWATADPANAAGYCPACEREARAAASCPGCEWIGSCHHHNDAEDGPRSLCCDHAAPCPFDRKDTTR